MLKIRWFQDHLILNMDYPYLGKTVFILRQGPGQYYPRSVKQPWRSWLYIHSSTKHTKPVCMSLELHCISLGSSAVMLSKSRAQHMKHHQIMCTSSGTSAATTLTPDNLRIISQVAGTTKPGGGRLGENGIRMIIWIIHGLGSPGGICPAD